MSMPYLYCESELWLYFANPAKERRGVIWMGPGSQLLSPFPEDAELEWERYEAAASKVLVPSEFLT